jgi:hypothetical protein
VTRWVERSWVELTLSRDDAEQSGCGAKLSEVEGTLEGWGNFVSVDAERLGQSPHSPGLRTERERPGHPPQILANLTFGSGRGCLGSFCQSGLNQCSSCSRRKSLITWLFFASLA